MRGGEVFGFNGQMKSTELGSGIYTAKFWEYDSRIGRRWNSDPVVKPWQSGYLCFSGNPIYRVDINGDDDYTVDQKGNISLLKKTKDKTDKLISLGKNGKIDFKQDGTLKDKSIIVDKGILNQKNHQEIDYDNNLCHDKIVRDWYEIKSQDDNKSLTLFKFLSQNTQVEWNLTQGNDKKGDGFSILTTTHNEGSVASTNLLYWYIDSKGYSPRKDYHNHPSGDGTPSGSYGDEGYAKELQKRFSKVKFNIYTSQDNKMNPYAIIKPKKK